MEACTGSVGPEAGAAGVSAGVGGSAGADWAASPARRLCLALSSIWAQSAANWARAESGALAMAPYTQRIGHRGRQRAWEGALRIDKAARLTRHIEHVHCGKAGKHMQLSSRSGPRGVVGLGLWDVPEVIKRYGADMRAHFGGRGGGT